MIWVVFLLFGTVCGEEKRTGEYAGARQECLSHGLTWERCCDAAWGEKGNAACWQDNDRLTYERCCTPWGWVEDADTLMPFFADRRQHDQRMDGPAVRAYAALFNCLMEVQKGGLMTGQKCSEFRSLFHEHVSAPPASFQLVGLHYPLVYRSYPFYSMLLPPYDFYHKSRLFPSVLWGHDEQALVEEGLMTLLSQGDVVVDAGASVGALTQIFAAAVGPSGQVHAFEPMRIPFQILNANVALGGFSNVWTYQVALGDNETTVAASHPRMTWPGSDISYTTLLNANKNADEAFKQRGDFQAVDVRRLDAYGLDRVDLIKIDVEGFEYRVLRGGEQTLRRAKPVIFAEIKKPYKRDVFDLLVTQMGYECHNVLTSMVSEYICVHPHRRQFSASALSRLDLTLQLWTNATQVRERCRVCRDTQIPLNEGEAVVS
ncbi:unnamed protein product [Vitrella brassicaformis CCMP3155]|uniref:Methyltransferase FkbM domain-containing protein n=2 Tax=Vitrella brassicaformis TaxID=1169539 RepID=A0A0G4H6P9_VITBC|nr:unnamed protein product [Vitrella brassicaformis CCMP3155]|eukprot:CEM39354.1 unnamed protein product [Vitrella brassicaformis CCMP3155]